MVADSLGQGPEASDSGVSCVITTERSALDALCSGTENFGAALRRRTIRRYGDIPARFGTEKQFLDGLSAHLVAAGWGLLARAEPITSGIAATPERAVNRH